MCWGCCWGVLLGVAAGGVLLGVAAGGVLLGVAAVGCYWGLLLGRRYWVLLLGVCCWGAAGVLLGRCWDIVRGYICTLVSWKPSAEHVLQEIKVKVPLCRELLVMLALKPD